MSSRWFRKSGCDAEAEMDAVKLRDPQAWAFLISRLVDIVLDPHNALAEDQIANSSLGYYGSPHGSEAMVYRLVGVVPEPQVLTAGHVADSLAAGALISQGQTRDRM